MNSIGSGKPIPVTPAEWSPTAFSLLGGFQKAELRDRAILAQERHRGSATGC